MTGFIDIRYTLFFSFIYSLSHTRRISSMYLSVCVFVLRFYCLNIQLGSKSLQRWTRAHSSTDSINPKKAILLNLMNIYKIYIFSSILSSMQLLITLCASFIRLHSLSLSLSLSLYLSVDVILHSIFLYTLVSCYCIKNNYRGWFNWTLWVTYEHIGVYFAYL